MDNDSIKQNSEKPEGELNVLEIKDLICKFKGDQDEMLSKEIADEMNEADLSEGEDEPGVKKEEEIGSTVPDILSSKTFNYVDMENLLVELPDNEAPNEYQPRKQDLPDVITIEDIIAYDYKYEESKRNDLVKLLEEWRFLSSNEDVRYPFAHKNGGKIAENDKVISKLRTIAKGVIIAIGKKLLSGEFNLTTVSFPIRAMLPKSVLDNLSIMTSYYPLYLNLALKNQDPLARFKFYVVSQISYFWVQNSFGKPLNPILGETLNAHYADGSRVYCEQTSHHPPISYLLYYGPQDSYRVYGPLIYGANAGLNSLTIIPKGWRAIEFMDTKQKITNTFPKEAFDGTFFGTCVCETKGEMNFEDKGNNIKCKLTFGKMKKKPSDYFEAEILHNNVSVSKVTGTYLGWIEIDGQRYFDYRYTNPFKLIQEKPILESDSKLRPDIKALNVGDHAKAQLEKEGLEQIQRNDAKLRKKTGKSH